MIALTIPALRQRVAVAEPDAKEVITPVRRRITGVDSAKAVAVLGVIWIHAVAHTPWQAWNWLGRFGAEFFAAVAAFFLVFRSINRPLPPFALFVRQKCARLMIPFVAWGTVYVLIVVPFFGWRVIHHLWFLPFLFVGLLCFWPVACLAGMVSHRWRLISSVLLAIAGLGISMLDVPLPSQFTAVSPEVWNVALAHSWSYVPSFFWGAALAFVWSGGSIAGRSRIGVATMGLAVTVAALFCLFITGHWMNSGLRNAAGLGWVLVALEVPESRVTSALAVIGREGYGIYLIHPSIIVCAAALIGHYHFSWSGMTLALTVVIALVTSFAISLLLRRSQWTAWLIPS